MSANARRTRIELLTDQVGLRREALGRYPHEFSGGQRQRIASARAVRRAVQAGRLRRAGLGAGSIDAGAGPQGAVLRCPALRSAGTAPATLCA